MATEIQISMATNILTCMATNTNMNGKKVVYLSLCEPTKSEYSVSNYDKLDVYAWLLTGNLC